MKKTKVGENEKKFKHFFEKKFGEDLLKGKKTYKSNKGKVKISIDESLEIGNKKILIEIDFGNMAKLLVGQYVLINELAELKSSKTLFVVIHFYKKYNPDRTNNNLEIIYSNIYKKKSIPFCSFTFEGFKNFCKNIKDIQDLNKKLIDEAKKLKKRF